MRADTTAPPKPSAQTQLLLSRMDDREKQEDERWDDVMANMDLLFAKVATVDSRQQQFEARLEAKVDMSSTVLEQLLKDQQLLAKQLEVTGQAVAKLTINQGKQQERPSSSARMDDKGDNVSDRHQSQHGGSSNYQRVSGHNHREEKGDRHLKGGFMPKMSCPRFDGNNPCIWKAKCQDYFQLLNIPESMWTTAASLHMDGNAEKWMQVYKMKHGLGDLEQFMAAVHEKFGSYDYQHAIDSLLELRQTSTVE